AYFIEHDPMPLLWALPTDKLDKSFSRTRLQPLIRENSCLAKHVRPDPDEFKLDEMLLDNMEIFMTGTSEPANLSSRPIARCILDEEAKYVQENKEEAHPVDLIDERTKTFHRRLLIHASTPSTEDSYFWVKFRQTDFRKFFVPCPHCGNFLTFEFSRESVVWDDPQEGELRGEAFEDWVEGHTYYKCPHCAGRIEDRQKIEMMQHGEWRATNLKAARSMRGYQLNSLFSPYVTFGKMARKFVEAKGELFTQLALQNFKNAWEALPYTRYAVKVVDDVVDSLKRRYRRGSLPDQYYFIVVGYDPGQNRTHWVAQAIGKGGQSWVIDWGTILGIRTEKDSPGIGAHFDKLSFCGVKPMLAIVDSGDWTEQVYSECYAFFGKLYPSKGTDAQFGTWNVTDVKTFPGLELYLYVDKQAKNELYASRMQAGNAPSLNLPEDADNDLMAGLKGQELIVLPSGRTQWKKLPNDHYGDCVKLGQLAWWVMRDNYENPGG
ncbi:MAG: terminase gpA endonuclease subunit, partial [Akkermansia sp.]